jgi:hypothetical protein
VLGSGHITHVHDALHAEAIACLQSLAYAQHWGTTKAHVETDSQVPVQAISSNEHDLARKGAIFCEIKFQAFLKFLFSRFLVAHGLIIRLWTALAFFFESAEDLHIIVLSLKDSLVQATSPPLRQSRAIHHS